MIILLNIIHLNTRTWNIQFKKHISSNSYSFSLDQRLSFLPWSWISSYLESLPPCKYKLEEKRVSQKELTIETISHLIQFSILLSFGKWKKSGVYIFQKYTPPCGRGDDCRWIGGKNEKWDMNRQNFSFFLVIFTQNIINFLQFREKPPINNFWGK